MKNPTQISDIQYDFAKTQIVVFFMILLLAVDSINPVKVFLHVFPNVAPWHVATLSIILIIYVFISEMKQLLYFSVKVFFHSILSIFFREVSVIGKQNIPIYGPVIFTGNHANQFIDSVVMLSTCQRTISFLMAEKSYRRKIVGHIAWAMGVVPVKRAQDGAKTCTGRIAFGKIEVFNDVPIIKVKGSGTIFQSEIMQKDKIRIPGTSIQFKVNFVHDDYNLEVESTHFHYDFVPASEPTSFQVMKRVDQKVVYEKVLQKLSGGGAIGIFPEGGSHDRTDLLPLKVGVALIAYSSLEKDGMSIPIIPVGLNYFRRHRFRGRVTVEYGQPIYIDPLTLPEYLKGGEAKREMCKEVLERVEDNMRSVIVSTPDYSTLKFIHTARRLYRSKYLNVSEKQDLSRRFAEGYQLLLQTKDAPKEWVDLQNRIIAYQSDLEDLGIRDYQVPGLEGAQVESDGDKVMGNMRLPWRIAELLLLFFASLIPALLLNLPVGLIANYWAMYRREKALAASVVKIKAIDVMMTEKVVICIVLVPSLWIFYGLMLNLLTDLDGPAIMLAISSFPLFSYMGVVTAEAGMLEFKDLKPVLKRLYPSTRCRLEKLPETRRLLQQDLRQLIKTIGPSLGRVYSEKNLNWAEYRENNRINKKDI